MFTFLCIIVAVCLAAFAVKEFRIVAVIVALGFLATKAAFIMLNTFLTPYDAWVCYFVYGVIEVIGIAILRQTNCHFFIMGLFGISAGFNFYTAYFAHQALETIESWHKFISIDALYPWLIGIIMILELVYLGWLNNYVSKRMRGVNDSELNFIDRLFRVTSPSLLSWKIS